jgi:hypothetical protein
LGNPGVDDRKVLKEMAGKWEYRVLAQVRFCEHDNELSGFMNHGMIC